MSLKHCQIHICLPAGALRLDGPTLSNLDLLESSSGGREGSLLAALDSCVSAGDQGAAADPLISGQGKGGRGGGRGIFAWHVCMHVGTHQAELGHLLNLPHSRSSCPSLTLQGQAQSAALPAWTAFQCSALVWLTTAHPEKRAWQFNHWPFKTLLSAGLAQQ